MFTTGLLTAFVPFLVAILMLVRLIMYLRQSKQNDVTKGSFGNRSLDKASLTLVILSVPGIVLSALYFISSTITSANEPYPGYYTGSEWSGLGDIVAYGIFGISFGLYVLGVYSGLLYYDSNENYRVKHRAKVVATILAISVLIFPVLILFLSVR